MAATARVVTLSRLTIFSHTPSPTHVTSAAVASIPTTIIAVKINMVMVVVLVALVVVVVVMVITLVGGVIKGTMHQWHRDLVVLIII